MSTAQAVRSFRPKAAAELVGCGEKVIYAAIKAKELVVRKGNFQGDGIRERYLIDEDKLMAWKDRCFPTVGADAPAASQRRRRRRGRKPSHEDAI